MSFNWYNFNFIINSGLVKSLNNNYKKNLKNLKLDNNKNIFYPTERDIANIIYSLIKDDFDEKPINVNLNDIDKYFKGFLVEPIFEKHADLVIVVPSFRWDKFYKDSLVHKIRKDNE